MMNRFVGGILLIGLAVIGCATTRQKPPPLQTYELGMWRATYRDYAASRQSICTGEPRWLQDEISSVNGVLGRWLDKTARGYDEVWTPGDLELLQKGAETLGPLVEVHEQNLRALRACGFADDRGYPFLVNRGLEYVDQARERMEEAPRIRAYVSAKEALELWREERPRREFAAKNRCPARVRVGSAQVYYAYATEEGQTRYLFCDGARVISKADSLEFQEPVGLSRREKRRVKPRNYLEAAKNYPTTQLDLPPELPVHESSARAQGPSGQG